MITWRPFPEIMHRRAAPFDGEEFLLAQPTPGEGGRPDPDTPFYVIISFWSAEDQSFCANLNGPTELIKFPSKGSYWSDINLPIGGG